MGGCSSGGSPACRRRWRGRRGLVLRRVDGDGAAVGVDHRDNVEGRRVDHRRDARIVAVAGQQRVDEVQRRLAAEELAAVDVAVDVEAGLFVGGSGCRVVDLEGEDPASAKALTDLVQGHQFVVPCRGGFEVGLDLLHAVVVVEADQGRLRRNKGAQRQHHQQRGGGCGALSYAGACHRQKLHMRGIITEAMIQKMIVNGPPKRAKSAKR